VEFVHIECREIVQRFDFHAELIGHDKRPMLYSIRDYSKTTSLRKTIFDCKEDHMKKFGLRSH